MLNNTRCVATLATKDLAVARAFYVDTLGLVPTEDDESGLSFTLDDGSAFRVSGPGAGGRVTAGAVYADLARLVAGERPILFGGD